MKIKCIANEGKVLSQKQIDIGEPINSEFMLTLNAEYIVYGISLWQGTVNYLTLNKYSNSFWHPAELFEIVDDSIPSEWHFKFYGYNDNFNLNAIWGYKELMSAKHYDGLIEREEEDMQIFLNRKEEIDEYYK